MTRVYISIGSNIEPRRNIVAAIAALREKFSPITASPVYESSPVGFEGNDFLNLVVAFDTPCPLEDVKNTLAAMEKQFGRKDSDKGFCSRTLDLDLLLYGNMIRHDDQFDLPRAEISEHAFVLKPLSDIAPNLKHPETGQTLAQMWLEFSSPGRLRPMPLPLD